MKGSRDELDEWIEVGGELIRNDKCFFCRRKRLKEEAGDSGE